MKYILMFIMMFALSAQAEVKPVKNLEPVIYTSVTRQELTWMYTMKTRFWEDGSRITVFYMDTSSPAHAKFCKEVLDISPDRFDKMVNSYINSGNASYFRLAQTPQEVLRKVGLIEGAIGYLDSDTVAINNGGYVNVIKIAK
jgi:hypothetical protein